MDNKIPIFPKATSMFIHSGNIINWNRLKRKPNLSPSDELCDCISKALGDYIASSDRTALQYVTEIYKVNTESVEILDENERNEVKITVKVFICCPQSPNVIQEAVSKVLNELGTGYVETLLLSLSPSEEEVEEEETSSLVWYSSTSIPGTFIPPSMKSKATLFTLNSQSKIAFSPAQQPSEETRPYEDKPITAGLQNNDTRRLSVPTETSHKKTLTMMSQSIYGSNASNRSSVVKKKKSAKGKWEPMLQRDSKGNLICRLCLDKIKPYWEVMEELVAAQKVLSVGICDLNKDVLEDLYCWAKVKPVINQVNLESCCVMPKELTEYAKDINVQLLTHNDSPVFVSKDALHDTVLSVSTDRDSEAWTPQWALRYSGIIKGRGIIKMKGYVFHAQRDPKKRLL